MNKIQTAEELFYNSKYNDYGLIHYKDAAKIAIRLTKLHVKAALESAAEKVEIKRKPYFNLSKEEQLICSEVWEEGCVVPSEGIVVNKDSILNAYPDELIK